ncbi:MAG: hypothetical protein ACOX9C_04435 [Kiritimatiellia bacterium]|jgi:hypothetical protein
MAKAYEIKGGASCCWGVDETMTDVGTITDVNYDDSIASEPCENQQGQVDGLVIYDGSMTVQLTIVLKAAGTPPAKGGVLTVGGKSFIIEKVGRAKRHKGKTIVTISATHHDNLALA